MGIGMYLREIGRGKDGARGLSRAHAADLWGQLLDGAVSDLEVGAFCLAMRVKGETPEEMAGFLDATAPRLHTVLQGDKPVVVIPSYNGARKIPVLTPLLALLLAREGHPVMIHGTPTENSRVFTAEVLEQLGIHPRNSFSPLAAGDVAFYPTAALSTGLQRLLEVRRVVQLRNSAHSLVKLMNPCAGPSLLVSSYTHPEYAHSMAATLQLVQANALLLRGTEGEAVADARRLPKMQGFIAGENVFSQDAQSGSLGSLPALPAGIDALGTAEYIHAVMDGAQPVPAPIAQQVIEISKLISRMESAA
jgi:anthranilate phosphoribosyltransferase